QVGRPLLGRGGCFFGGAAQAGEPGFGRLSLMIDGREHVREYKKLIGAITFLGGPAVDHRVAEPADMARGFPDARVHDDRTVEPDHVVTRLDVVAPPGFLDVPLELDAEGTIIPETIDSAIDLARGKDDPSPLAKRDQLVHF